MNRVWFPPFPHLYTSAFPIKIASPHTGLILSRTWISSCWFWYESTFLVFDSGLFNFRLLQKLDFPTMKFSLYFLAYEDKNDIPKDKGEKAAWVFSRKATLELTQWVWDFIFLYILHFFKSAFLYTLFFFYLLNSNQVYLLTLHL